MSSNPEAQVLGEQAITMVEKARAFEIRDNESASKAAEFLTGIKGLQKKVEEFFAPLKKAAHEAHKRLTTSEREQLGPLEDAERVVKGRLAAYEQEQERLRLEEQRRQEAEAKKREEDARLAEAADLEASGRKEEALALIEEPVIALVIPISRPPSPKGISYREQRRAEVTDFMALVQGVVAGSVPKEALSVNQSFLDNQARVLGKSLAYPGVVVRVEKIVAAGSR